ncbi:phospholipase D-like domain-containing protein [Vibrio cyclitrophicus]|uniref:phospholipase D-like domain-containing protein n=1 Tax=Vibrio cyclitrophicus TaxID=47951 RepID=UPI000C84C88F|nr:phospholipase D-like domain-containing protein [Vibrio cyclitrophicus]PMJ75534.1 hypothetical protein BCU15_19935 [Vibrio cyclitrophicus]
MKLLQQTLQSGFSDPAYIKEQLSLLNEVDNHKELYISSGYLRSTGSKLLSEYIELNKFSSLTAIIGVNNQSTSLQGIEYLGDLGFQTYMVNTNRRDCIFHLKTMLSIGSDKAVLLTGSANLTGQGMTRNFEHQIAVEFDLSDADDFNEVNKLKAYLDELPTAYEQNIQLADLELLEDMLVMGQLENELIVKTSTSKEGDPSQVTTNKGPAINIPRPVKKVGQKLVEASSSGSSDLGKGVLIWKKNKLSKSDAQISGTDNTNVKGYMTMGNKSYRKDRNGNPVNNKTYMREDVFGDLDWVTNAEIEREEAFAYFEFWIDGQCVSEYCKLLITDKASREPSEHGLDDQKQPTTALHVCGLGKNFTRVLGKNLLLYKLDTNHYRIEVN